jgi:hypothetical protein
MDENAQQNQPSVMPEESPTLSSVPSEVVVPTAVSKKTLYIIIGAIAVLALFSLIPAIFGFIFSRALYGVAGVDVSSHINGSTTYSDQKGNSATIAPTSYPDAWPSDVSRYENATLVGNISTPQGVAVDFTTADSAETVVNYYKSQLATLGWKVEVFGNRGNTSILNATKDSRQVTLLAEVKDGTTNVTLAIESK